jgi:hypothetical protein
MKYLQVALAVATIMVLSTMTLGLVHADGTTSGFDTFDTSSNGITNFSVQVNNQPLVVFKYFNVSGTSTTLNLPHIGEEKMTPLFWQGFGNVTITPAIPYSTVGNFSYNYYQAQQLEYVYFYQQDYVGILLTTGQINESANQVLISGQNLTGGVTVSYINTPLSSYNFTPDSYQYSGQSYQGNYSSFSYSSGQITNYSLTNEQSSVSVVSNITSSSGSILSFNTKGLATPGNTVMFASDSLFPLVYLNAFNSSISVRLANGFHFDRTEDLGQVNSDGSSNQDQDPFISTEFPVFQEHIFRIMMGSKTLGYADVYGQESVNGTTLRVNSPLSFVLIRFLPTVQSTNGTNRGNSNLGNATTEIYIDNQAYFVPFSPNVTSQNLSFDHGTLYFQFIQNGTQQFVIVIQGNFTVSQFALTGPGGKSTHYIVTRSGNETVVSFWTNGSGQGNLSLSIAPYLDRNNQLPLVGLVISVTALIAVAASLIVYSRRKWERDFEKE